MMAGTPTRVRSAHVAWVAERMNRRDRAIVETVNRLHLVTGRQLERLHFMDLAEGRSRTVSRSRVLARLVRWRVLAALPRRVGGAARGSTGTVYALDTTGYRLLKMWAAQAGTPGRVRAPGAPSERWTRHILSTAELYVTLVDAERAGGLRLGDFRAEPAAWWPDGLGGYLKPDAYAEVASGRTRHLWWLEVDLGTESLPTLRRKLETYLGFVRRGQRGPHGGVPRVLVVTVTNARRAAVLRLMRLLPPPAAELFRVTTAENVLVTIKGETTESEVPP